MSLREVALQAGVSFPTVGRFLNGEAATSTTLDKLVEFINRVEQSSVSAS